MKLGLAVVFLMGSLLRGFAQSEAAASPTPYLMGRVNGEFPDTIEIVRGVEIGQAGGRPLVVNLAYPKTFTGSLPAVLYIHGGGWKNGTARSSGQIAFLAQKGFFAMTVDYRLSGEAKWPAQIEDCKYAVRWLRAEAAKYRVDLDRIGVWGTSAGGHLAACLGVMDEARFEGTSGHSGQSSRVQAVVDGCGPTDFTQGSDGLMGAKDGTSAEILVQLLGGTFQEMPDRWRDASPLAHVKPGAPPFLLVHGDSDPAVPIRHSEKLAAALQTAGGRAELLVLQGGGHGWQVARGRQTMTPSIPEALDQVAAFLQRELAPR